MQPRHCLGAAKNMYRLYLNSSPKIPYSNRLNPLSNLLQKP